MDDFTSGDVQHIVCHILLFRSYIAFVITFTLHLLHDITRKHPSYRLYMYINRKRSGGSPRLIEKKNKLEQPYEIDMTDDIFLYELCE